MDYKKKLITLREENHLTKTQLYGGIYSKGKYLTIENEENSSSITIEEMTSILDRLGMGWLEFIEYTDLSTKKNTDYGRLKLELLDIARNLNEPDIVSKKLHAFLTKIEPGRFESTQTFSTYIATLFLAKILGVVITYDQDEIYRFTHDLYLDRKEYYVVDYEIIGNISTLIETDNLLLLTEALFPCALFRGHYHDDLVQVAAINIAEVLIKQKKYDKASEWISEILNMINQEGFIKNTLTTLKLLYLREEVSFRITKNMKHYSELLRYADLFKDMGETILHKAILNDTLHQISKEYDIEIPNDHILYHNYYTEQLDRLEDKVDYGSSKTSQDS